MTTISEALGLQKLHTIDEPVKGPSYIDNSEGEWKSQKFIDVAKRGVIDGMKRQIGRKPESYEEFSDNMKKSLYKFLSHSIGFSDIFLEYDIHTDNFSGKWRNYSYGKIICDDAIQGNGYTDYLDTLKRFEEWSSSKAKEREREVAEFIEDITHYDCVPYLQNEYLYEDGKYIWCPILIFQK